MQDLTSLIFEDGEFQASVARHVLSYLSSRQKTGYTTTGLYYALHRAHEPKGLVTIVHGFSEGMYKYRELTYYLLHLGYSTLAYEHRGHARSVRVTDEGTAVHIDSFDTYVEDLKSISDEIASQETDIPHFLFGHSMGGCIATLFAERNPSYYDRLVLSSPMLELKIAHPAKALATPVASLMCRMGKDEDSLSVFPEKESFESSNSTSLERWQYVKNVRDNNILLRMSRPTWSWLKAALAASREARENADRIKVPTLIFLAQDDGLVDNDAAIQVQKRNSLVTLIQTRGTKHEIMSSPKAVLVDYYKAMDDFLSKAAAPSTSPHCPDRS